MRTTSKHTRKTLLRAGIIGLTMVTAAAVARPAFAGPPLLCHPFDIGVREIAAVEWRVLLVRRPGRATTSNIWLMTPSPS